MSKGLESIAKLCLALGLLLYLSVCSCCDTEAWLCASTAEAPMTSPDLRWNCPYQVWICPGDSAILYYSLSGDVTSAEISPVVGSVVLFNGQVFVKPTTDTVYTLTAEGDCKVKASVWVRVIEEGDVYKLSAATLGEIAVWSIEVPLETHRDSIVITSIKVIPCFPGDEIHPKWHCKKTNLDGLVTEFDVYPDATSPASVPLVGVWEFVPLDGLYPLDDNVCFELTVKCL